MKKGQFENKTNSRKKLLRHIERNVSLLLFLFSFLVFNACTKSHTAVNHNVVWKGSVLEKVTNKKIPFATIYLYEREIDLLGSSSRILIDTYQADKDGNFNFTFTDKVDYGYTIKVIADKYYLSEEYTPNENKGVASNTTFYLDPYAWIKFHVKNVNPYDENDKILVNNLKPLLGNRVDTFLLEQSIGNTKFDIITWYYKNQIKYIIRDSITNLVPHDTTYFEIKY